MYLQCKDSSTGSQRTFQCRTINNIIYCVSAYTPKFECHREGENGTEMLVDACFNGTTAHCDKIIFRHPYTSVVTEVYIFQFLIVLRLRSVSVPFPFRFRSVSVPFPFRFRSVSVPFPLRLLSVFVLLSVSHDSQSISILMPPLIHIHGPCYRKRLNYAKGEYFV